MTKGVKYLSYADNTGYGSAAKAYILGLLRAGGWPLQWLPFTFGRYRYTPWLPTANGRTSFEEHENYFGRNADAAGSVCLRNAIESRVDYDTMIVHTQPEYWLNYWEKSPRCVGCTVWETDHIPQHWKTLLNTADHILVPSRFNADVFESDGVIQPISVIPHIYRTPPPLSDEEVAEFRSGFGIPNDRFVFYTINTWTARKAMWDLVKAYLEAFTNEDPVTLVIKTDPIGVRNERSTTNRPTAQNIAELLAGRSNVPDIHLLCNPMSARAIDLLHRTGDCYVSLTHGEGWGLGAFDAAGIGNPVLITGWGGHLDFLGTNYFGLVDYRLIPVRDGLVYTSSQRDQSWAQADHEHAVHLMREIVRKPDSVRLMATRIRDRIRTEFSEVAVINRLIEVLA